MAGNVRNPTLRADCWAGGSLTPCASAAAALPPGGADGPRNLAPAALPGAAERAAVSSKRGLCCRRMAGASVWPVAHSCTAVACDHTTCQLPPRRS